MHYYTKTTWEVFQKQPSLSPQEGESGGEGAQRLVIRTLSAHWTVANIKSSLISPLICDTETQYLLKTLKTLERRDKGARAG